MNFSKKIKARLILGAIGDCIGGLYEGMEGTDSVSFNNDWQISEDAQLTLYNFNPIVRCCYLS